MTSSDVKISDIISPNFHELHKYIKTDSFSEYWLRGGRGSTKSSFISIQIILGMMRDPNANTYVFRRYEAQLQESVVQQLEWATIVLGVEHLWRFYSRPYKAIYKETGQKIVFRGADSPKNVKGAKISKGYMKYAWFEEVDQFGGMADIRNLAQSLFRGTDEQQVSFFSYNPPKSARSWANAETKIEKKGRKVHFSDYTTVPKHWLGKRFFAEAEHLKETNNDAYCHEYLGEEIGTGLEVFNNVTIRNISDHEISYFDNFYQGLDFGYAVDPVCFVQFNYDVKYRKLHIFGEVSGIGISNRVLAERLTDDQKLEKTTADSAEPKSIAELRDDYGMNISGAVKGAGSIEFGIKWLQDLTEIIIDPIKCPLAANEFVNYALLVNRAGDVVSKYPDKDNHCFAGDTLISTIEGQKRIDCIEIGDLVKTRKGFKPVNKVFNNGYKKVVKTKLLNGKSLTLTDTHNIITKTGDVMFKELTSNHTVYYEAESCGFIETENQRLQYLKAKNTEDILRANEEMTGCILRNLAQVEKTNTFMLKYINIGAGIYPKVVIYTIKMAILSIIKYSILFALMSQNILKNIKKNTMVIIEILLGRILNLLDRFQKRGTQAKRVNCGTVNTGRKLLKIYHLLRLFVSNVVVNMKLKNQTAQDFVVINVSQHGEEHQERTMLSKNVRDAEQSSQQISTVKQDFAHEHVIEVWDLEIDEEHEYFANGLLVHNCIDAVRYGCEHLARQQKHKKPSKIIVMPTVSNW